MVISVNTKRGLRRAVSILEQYFPVKVESSDDKMNYDKKSKLEPEAVPHIGDRTLSARNDTPLPVEATLLEAKSRFKDAYVRLHTISSRYAVILSLSQPCRILTK